MILKLGSFKKLENEEVQNFLGQIEVQLRSNRNDIIINSIII